MVAQDNNNQPWFAKFATHAHIQNDFHTRKQRAATDDEIDTMIDLIEDAQKTHSIITNGTQLQIFKHIMTEFVEGRGWYGERVESLSAQKKRDIATYVDFGWDAIEHMKELFYDL